MVTPTATPIKYYTKAQLEDYITTNTEYPYIAYDAAEPETYYSADGIYGWYSDDNYEYEIYYGKTNGVWKYYVVKRIPEPPTIVT